MEIHELNMSSVYQELRKIFDNGRNETFESGMYSVFSSEFTKLLNRLGYHQWVIDLVAHYILVYEWVSYDVAGEACCWLGHADHGEYCGNPAVPHHIESSNRRRLALEYILFNAKHASLRDDASCGISYINDPQSIPVMREAIEREDNDWLKGWYQQIIDELLDTQSDRPKNSANYT